VITCQFQFPLHRDPRCNQSTIANSVFHLLFQFPLHRDPRCNLGGKWAPSATYGSFSSLYIGILAATWAAIAGFIIGTCFSSLYIGILAATIFGRGYRLCRSWFQFPLHRDPRCNSVAKMVRPIAVSFSSLYIGILAATETLFYMPAIGKSRFSSLYIGILAATA